MLFAAFAGGSNLFLYCFYGHSAHDVYFKLSKHYFEANWLSLSPDLQKFFVMLIANAQRPLFYHGSSLAHLNLNTFLKVK